MEDTGVRSDLANPLRSVLSLAGVGAALIAMGVAVRSIALLIDPDTRSSFTLAIAQPVPDLMFLGVRQIFSIWTVVFVVIVVLNLVLLNEHQPWHRALYRWGAAVEEVAQKHESLAALNQRVLRSRVDPASSSGERDRLAAEFAQRLAELEKDSALIEALDREFKRTRDPIQERVYPIVKYGMAFSGRTTYLVFLCALAYLVAFPLLVSRFPVDAIGALWATAAIVLFTKGTVQEMEIKLPLVALTALVVVLGCALIGGMTYRSPVGAIQWTGESVLPPGRYALIGTTEQTTYVVACADRSSGVLAVPSSTILGVTLGRVPDDPRGASLFELLVGSQPLAEFGSLSDCA